MTSRHMRGTSQEHMIRRRDAAGGEMEALAKVMSDPKPDPEEVAGYVREMLRKEHITGDEARQILASVPHDPEALRVWARRAFAMVMHQGIHGHAAYPKQLYPSPQQEQPDQAAPASDATPTIQ